MAHKFDKSGYYLIQDSNRDKFVSFAICNECWNEKVKTDNFLYRARFFAQWIGNDKIPWKPELIPENGEFDKFKERMYN